MRLVADAGLWSTGRLTAAPPLVAVLEVEGAVLTWVVDQPSDDVQLTFTDVRAADWLHRLFGDAGHVALASALGDAVPEIDLAGVEPRPAVLAPLRRLAIGHWLRRWWPAGSRAGIAALDRALLDAEVALLTAGAEDFLGIDLVDLEVAELLSPFAAELTAHLRGGDPRVVDLVRAAVDVAAEIGVDGPGWADAYAARDDESEGLARTREYTRDDFALAAGQGGGGAQSPIATGTASVRWSAVPPGIFDAAEDTVSWSVEQSGDDAIAVIRVVLAGSGSPAGIPVEVRAGSVRGSGTLDTGGAVALSLFDGDAALAESVAWGHDWSPTTVIVGADVDESSEARMRARIFARDRLDNPGADAFLAEILAAESDY